MIDTNINIIVQRDIAADIETVWAILENFGDLSWVPAADNVEVIGVGVGMTRRILMPGLPPIEETLQSLDAEKKTLRYTIPMTEIIPFDRYVADVTLSTIDNNTTHVDWRCSFDTGAMPEADARALIEGNYAMILDGLEAASLQPIRK